MRSQNYKTKICIGFAIILSFAIGLAQQHQVFAAGWIGSGTQSGGIPASGGGGGGGAIASYGHSWIYYQYTGGGHNEITFTPTGDTFGYKGLPISSECAKDGSGFWHHGYNVNPSESAPDWDTYTMIDSGKWGHYTSMPYGLVNASWFWAGDYITHNNNELGHSVGGIYRASYYGSEDGVFNDFKTAYQFINGKSYNGSQFPDDLYAFCFSDEMRNMVTTFQGHTTINVADGAKTVKSGWDKFNSDTYETDSASVNLTFTHKLKRT
ncbi:hypothetical protein IJ098_03730, partial [Candidatus Saccharibacteria bacterium]|nr:hypothetical protein [Candidatus Saccharibacteria bacterium]